MKLIQNNCKNQFIKMILVFLILNVTICISILTKDIVDYQQNSESVKELMKETIEFKEETEEISIDWSKLKNINEDIIGWIEIENTNINYPILYGNYYLNHSYDRTYTKSGSIFTMNSDFIKDKEIVVYGHNMKNGKMFSKLSKYMEKDFLNLHKSMKIYTPKATYKGIIFSAYTNNVEDEGKNTNSLNFEDKIAYYKKLSKYDSETSKINKIVKLSTCSYVNAKMNPTEQRYYIIFQLIPIK